LDKDNIKERLTKLNDVMLRHKELAEEDYENENLAAITLALCASVGMQGHRAEFGMMELLEIAFSTGWTLARAFDDGDEDLEDLMEDFPPIEDLAEQMMEELSVYFRDESELDDMLNEIERKDDYLQ
jgi:hypothetical protein